MKFLFSFAACSVDSRGTLAGKRNRQFEEVAQKKVVGFGLQKCWQERPLRLNFRGAPVHALFWTTNPNKPFHKDPSSVFSVGGFLARGEKSAIV